jgi:mRNA interferase RelE/StbE
LPVSKAGKQKYRLFFLPDALEEWHGLDGSIRQTLKKLLAKRLDNPRVPGGALHGPLSGCYKIQLAKQGVRLVYEVEDDKLIVMVLAVDRREDSAAYKAAVDRLAAGATALSKTEGAKRTVGTPAPRRAGKK